MLTTCLLVAALAAGVTGAWSPCGLSMVETLAPGGFARTRVKSALAAATFTVGALAGGAITFGGLALLGSLLGAGGATALGAAAVVAVAAAAAEARGLRIAPQIRRQVPETWRRERPVALATAGYGVLLGLGLAFGLGRALPVIALAPRAHAASAVLCVRPGILLGLRRVDAVALAAVALALGTAAA